MRNFTQETPTTLSVLLSPY